MIKLKVGFVLEPKTAPKAMRLMFLNLVLEKFGSDLQ